MWILITSIVAIVFRDQFTSFGINAVVFVNCMVFLAAVLQYGSLFSFLKNNGREFDTFFEIHKRIKSKKEDYWSILSKLDDVYKYAAGVDSSRVEGDKMGLGTKRYCTSGTDKKWSEEVIEWVEGERFNLNFDTAVEGFPFTVEKMHGGWRLYSKDSKNFVAVWFKFTSNKLGVFLPLFCYIWSISMRKAMKKMDETALLAAF